MYMFAMIISLFIAACEPPPKVVEAQGEAIGASRISSPIIVEAHGEAHGRSKK